MNVWRAATFALLAISIVLVWILWSRSRKHRVEIDLNGGNLRSLMHSMAGLTWGRVTGGNAVTIVQNSAFFDALLEDIARARHHIHLETFLWRDGAISDRITDALGARARDGIEVRVLVDQRGANKTSPETWRRLREAGCDFRVYHRARLREFALYNIRDHRKVAVIDGRIGYTFGHGIADMWGGTPDQPSGWRDTAARFEGPVVTELQTAFFDNWISTTHRAIAGEAYFPDQPRAGSTPLHVAYLRHSETSSAVQRLYYMAIAAAREEIVLQNPYFLPDRQALRLFAEAVKRGVEISIMLPAAETSDFSIVQHASHHFYGPLLRLGVRVHEHTQSGLHQKVMIVDRIWCSIGSTNFDPRSFRINEEITVAALDERLAGELIAAYENDLRNAQAWTYERWRQRAFCHRLTDRASALMRRQL